MTEISTPTPVDTLSGDASRLRHIGIGAVLLVLGTFGAARTALAQSAAPIAAARSYDKPADSVLKSRLSPLQYAVTQQAFTEPAFMNEYWNNHEAGIYVDIVSGEPLFSSVDKYDSKTGWPSFTKPLDASNITTQADHQLADARTEVRSAHANSHLGHIFNDGPRPAGLRYCMNSAALRFVPVDILAAQGYGAYLPRFKKR